MKAKWTRNQARGILTPTERMFLRGERKFNPAMVRYLRSHILRKTQKSRQDLNLIYKHFEPWEIFPGEHDKTTIQRLVEEVVRIQYYENYLNERWKRTKQKAKRKINKNKISRQTKIQLSALVEQALAACR